jgi:Terminase large subunit, T4likevirus-type, N-terminal
MTAVDASDDVGRFRGPFPGQQTKFFERTERWVLYGGAGGGGKTVCLIGKFCQQLAIESQRFREGKIRSSKAWGLYLRRNTTDLKQAIDISHQIFLDVDPDAEFNINAHLWTFPNCGDAKFEFGHMEHERSKFKYKSNAYTYVAPDELTEFTESQIEYMDTRLRTTDKVLGNMLQICAGSNPDGVGLLWVRRKFIENREPETVYRVETVTSSGKVINFDQIFIPARLRDNPALYESGQYEAALMNKRPEVREAILEGNWYITAGAFLAECWDSHVHVVENHPVPRNATVCRSADFGTRSFSSVTWWYVDRDGAFTAFHNLYVKGHTASMLADRIREVEEFYGYWDDDENCSTLIGPLDEDCWNTTGHTGPSIAETLRRKGVRFRRSNKNRLLGAAELIGRLVERIPGATEDEPERPMIRWMVRCIDPIKTLPVLPVDPNNPNLPDTTGEDHCYDETTYMCMWRPLKPRDENEVDDDEDAPVIDIGRRRKFAGSGRLGEPPGGW